MSKKTELKEKMTAFMVANDYKSMDNQALREFLDLFVGLSHDYAIDMVIEELGKIDKLSHETLAEDRITELEGAKQRLI